MIRRMVLMLVLLGLFFGGVFGWKFFTGAQMRAAMAARGAPVVTVSTTTVNRVDWQPALRAVATLRSGQSVNVTAQLAGQITALHFDSGAQVQAGDLLLEQYSADTRAQLKSATAALQLADIELSRRQKLVAQQLVSDAELDTARTRLDQAQADVEALQVTLAKKAVRAPFAGQLGIRQVDLGQYLEPGDPIVRLESTARLFADFPLPQEALPSLAVDQAVSVSVDAWPDTSFTGRIQAIEPAVDPGTRNVRVRARLDNGDGRLRPGMFAQVRVTLPARGEVLAIPQAAITFSPFGDSVYVVQDGTEGPTVHNIYVNTGEKRGDLVEVTSGLEAGQQVVTAGQLKLREGARVAVDNSVPVSADPDPRPPES